jgi:multidrug resistance efflux pump
MHAIKITLCVYHSVKTTDAHTCSHTHARTHTFSHSHTHTHTHTYIHTHSHAQDLTQQQVHSRQLEASLLESHKASTQSLAALTTATVEHTALHAQITDLRVKVGGCVRACVCVVCENVCVCTHVFVLCMFVCVFVWVWWCGCRYRCLQHLISPSPV